MANVLQPHHHDQFAARRQGLVTSLAADNPLRLSPADYRRMLGFSPEQIRARRVAKAKAYVGAAALFVMATAGTVLIQGVL